MGCIRKLAWSSLKKPAFFSIFGHLKRKGNQNFGIKPKDID
ncbi:hypothetical protein C943_01408 [Mariniradius saccharolyticus AK6]|uniref:Uncharacterized protein n=1 Tax=Mariniradius saccharolyticus AK6 TaxID=1239962 RepID=M7Y4F8_9BACT|nr:hypothetical protein C943_01408 [Mariniradius saccharolyticus AK6]